MKNATLSRVAKWMGIASLLLITIAAAQGAPPLITLQSDAIVVTGLQPRTEIVLVGMARGAGIAGSIRVIPFVQAQRDDDGDGAITFSNPVPVRSVWVVVDVSSGEYATAAPADFALTRLQISPSAFKRDGNDEVEFLEQEMPRLFFVLVRPGKGVWGGYEIDGGRRDKDRRQDGKVTIGFDSIADVRKRSEKSPARLKKDDVLVGIDPGHLDTFVVRVGR